MSQTACRLTKPITRTVTLDYWLHLPDGYDQGGEWPLILFLHGAGERGNDLESLKRNPLPAMLDDPGISMPFIVVSPQCPPNGWWSTMTEELLVLLDDVESRYRVDRESVYVTGLSMGGFGTWALAIAHPERFAAIAPICGGYHGPAWFVNALREVPVWAFHGARDPVVPLEMTEHLVSLLREAGGKVRLTVYPELEHDSWTVTYHNPELYTWLLSHRNSRR
ncbi:MAG: phospholipase [Chloroflexi bacterium]|jgi:predicted peptidase|nr:phospholipase [Chloroflexota bacterium]